jgi:WD40 repeat protein/S1-C subfamily serine protease
MIQSRLGRFTALIAVVLPVAGWTQGLGRTGVVGLGKKATALVEVTAPGPEGGGSGSAFCIDRSGLFITNAHVIDEAEGGRAELRLVLETGRSSNRLILRARVVRSDDRLDLALLKVDPAAELNPLTLGRDEDLTETMPVTTFGYPFGRTLAFRRDGYPDITVLESKITSLRKDEGRLEKIQFDNQLNPGNSGGPVLGPDGKVVGVAQATVKGAAINFAIPVGQLRAFLEAPGLVFDPPALPYKDRAKPVTWTIKALPAAQSGPLPEGLTVSVKVATDVTPTRTFGAKAVGDGTFRVTLTPVPSDSENPVELRVLIGRTWITTTVPDRVIRVGRASFLLSDIQQLNDNPPRVISRRGEIAVGPIEGLGRAKAQAGPRGKTVTIDLSSASLIQVSPSAARKPLGAIEAVVELKRGDKVLATRAKRLEMPGAPMLLVDRATGRGVIIQPPAPPVMRSPDPATEHVKLSLGGFLQADVTPRGAGLAIKPPAARMGDALLADGSEAATETRRFQGHSDAVLSVVASPDGLRLLSGSKDRTMILWDRDTGRVLRRFRQQGGWIQSVAISPDGRRALSGGEDTVVRLWDLESGDVVREFRGHTEWVFSVAFSRDGRLVYSASGGRYLGVWRDGIDSAIRVWDVETGREVRRLEGHRGIVWSVAVSPDGRRVLSGGQDRTSIVWDAGTGAEIRRFRGHTDHVTCAAFLPDGLRAVSCGDDRTIRLWNVETGQELHCFRGHHREPIWVAISPDGRCLVSSDHNGRELRLWNVESRNQVGSVSWGNEQPVFGCFTSDGRQAAWGGTDGIVRLYRLPSVDTQKRERIEPLVRPLDAKLSDLVVGGGGRDLILNLKEARQIAIFDVNAAEIVKRIDVASDDVLVAAGAEKLILFYPKVGLFQRWNLKTWTLEVKGEKQPIQGRIHNIVMGSDSEGPILAFWSAPQKNEPAASGPARCSFIDPITFRVLKIEPPRAGNPMGGAWTSEGSFRIYCQSGSDRIHLRASPGGALFGSWCVSHGPSGVQTIAIEGRSVRLGYEHEGVGHVVPGVDGQTFFTGAGHRRSSDGKPIDPVDRGRPSTECLIPSTDPNYFLAISGANLVGGSLSGPVSASVRLTSSGEVLAMARGLDEMADAGRNPGGVTDAVTIDKRFHFIPAADLLITVPSSDDRLVLRRLSLEDGIARSVTPILAVTSATERAARPGQRWTHQIQVRSTKGGTTFDLTHGPEGLSVSGDGSMRWQVPLNAERREYEAIVTIGDASGKQIFHTVRMKVE